MAQFSPMMQNYIDTKEQYKDCVLFYRLGDFYEMFFEDAINVSRELELTLTGKDCGQEERAPMCGVPFHAADNYINRLVDKGYKVAICEQVEGPKTAKGLVKREVVKVVTPGTNFNPMALDETRNNYIMCIAYMGNSIGIAVSDITTGEFLVTEVTSGRELIDEINRFSPSEVLCNESFGISGIDIDDLKNRLGFAMSELLPWYFDESKAIEILKSHFKVMTIEGLGVSDYPTAIVAAGALFVHEIGIKHHTQLRIGLLADTHLALLALGGFHHHQQFLVGDKEAIVQHVVDVPPIDRQEGIPCLNAGSCRRTFGFHVFDNDCHHGTTFR